MCPFKAEKYQNVLRSFGFEKSDVFLSESLNRRFNSLMSTYQQLGMDEAIENRYTLKQNNKNKKRAIKYTRSRI